MDYQAIDREMSRRVAVVFGNPKRHRFYSEADGFQADLHFGPRGARIKGRKTVCYHCGARERDHADSTEHL